MSKHLELLHKRHARGEHIVNVNEVDQESLTIGQHIADGIAAMMGSWRFIITQASIMAIWIMLNLVGWFSHWDIYPFVLLNLAMSAQAAFATPLIMMSQNRQAAKDRLTAEQDYHVNQASKEEIEELVQKVVAIAEHLSSQDEKILETDTRILDIDAKILGIATTAQTILQQVEVRKSQKKAIV